MNNTKDAAVIYEDLSTAQKIPIRCITEIEDKRFTEFIVYESYRPSNLKDILDYMKFCVEMRCNLVDKMGEEEEELLELSEASKGIKDYYRTNLQTTLPSGIDQDNILVFDSNFESGNLHRANIVSLKEYNLFLNPDTNTKGNSQWFYFAVTNTTKDSLVKFNILNCTRSVGLFKDGMRPMVFSEQDFIEHKIAWSASTFNVTYNKNNIERKIANGEIRSYFTLSFSYKFKYSSDRVYFAYSRPYTMNSLLHLLKSVLDEMKENASYIKSIEHDLLQKRIKEFIIHNKLDQIKNTGKKHTKDKAINLIHTSSGSVPDIHYSNWITSESINIESKGIIYRQEILCKTFCGLPIILLTITNVKYVLLVII